MTTRRQQQISHPRFDPPRPINAWERHMLEMFTAVPFEGHSALRRQIPGARVESECGCGCLTSHFVVKCAPTDRLPNGYPNPIYDLHGTDLDGMHLHAILFLRDGYLSSLEVIRADSSAFAEQPNPWRFLDVEKNIEQERRNNEGRGRTPAEIEAAIQRVGEMLRKARRELAL
jgi:hypothetical protein